jgi:protocatechuate 3,4-dioxygenase beta subunit
MMEGPYFADKRLHRSDIRQDTNSKNISQGVPLDLSFQVSQIQQGGCLALKDVIVDIWQCDALGIYSSQIEVQTTDSDFLRGYQTTDATGNASFKTVYPGWYAGRAAHIHFKIRLVSSDNLVTHEFGSQLFFDESVTDAVYALEPYNGKGKPDTLNAADGIYKNGGHQLLLSPKKTAEGGYAAVFDIALNIG